MKSPRARLKSPVQEDVYDLIVRGFSNKEIAKDLGMVVRTVKHHVTSVLRATGASRRLEVIAAHGRATANGRVTGLRSRVTSSRRLQVYDLLVEGATYKAIAGPVGISERTVKFHAQRLLEDLGLPTQARLIAAHWGTEGSAHSGGLGDVHDLIAVALKDARNERDRIDNVIKSLERPSRFCRADPEPSCRA